jgi:hypothetical protein
LTLIFEKKKYEIIKTFFLIFGIVFIIFLFTSDGHRYTMDEDMGAQMALGMATLESHPDFIEGGTGRETKNLFNMGIEFNPYNAGPLCTNAITCFPVSVFYGATEAPFIALNHYFHIITNDTHVFSTDDFADAHYVFWRNSENPDFVFLELFYAPFFLAFSVGIFFLICLEYKFTRQTSIILSFVLAFSTIIWAFSNTSLNVIPTTFFILLGYLFFKKFRRLNQSKFLLLTAAAFGFAFLIRDDVILFIIPVWLFLVVNILKRLVQPTSHKDQPKNVGNKAYRTLRALLNSKIHTLLFYSIPLLISYGLRKLLNAYDGPLRYIVPEDRASAQMVSTDLGAELSGFFFSSSVSHILAASYGMLFSPGVGLFIFSPILITVFFSFPDFFRKHKSECLLLLSFFVMNIIYHADMTSWHGLSAWGSRYLLMVIPFLLIPLGASLEKRNKKFMLLLILAFGTLGVLFNISYVVQDVHWFVWSTPGSAVGLFSLGLPQYGQFNLWLNDVVIWTFQFSQLTHSLSLMFTGLQHDVYLLHTLGTSAYLIIFASLLSFLFYLLRRVTKHNIVSTENSKLSEK